MSMNRHGIQRAAKLAQEFLDSCEEALKRIDRECARSHEWDARRQNAEFEPWVRHKDAKGVDHSWGSKETGALRRRSMDLTRELAELRRP